MIAPLLMATALAGGQPVAPQGQAVPEAETGAEQVRVRDGMRADAAGILGLADRFAAAGRHAQALALLEALAPEDQARTDVRFARAVLLIDLDRAAEAEPILADLVSSRPEVTRFRLEHGRALAALGRSGAAARQLRRALADNPPRGVVTTVQAALAAMRARQSLFGSVNAGLAPDSNINAATSAESIELYGLPFILDGDARARSGTGLVASAEVGWRRPLRRNLAAVTRINGFARIYPKAPNDDFSLELRGGLEIGSDQQRITPEITWLRRWYAGTGYVRALGGALRFDQSIDRAWQMSAIADARRMTHDRNAALDGWAASLRIESSHALAAGNLLVLGGTTTRTKSRDDGYSHWLSEVDAAFYRDWARGWSTGMSLSLGQLQGDMRQLPFAVARNDWRWRASASLANRKFAFLGALPTLRLVHEAMTSPIALYRYRRTRVELTLDRRF